MPVNSSPHWYGVRCIFEGDGGFEERITLWRAADEDEAIEKAETEARAYAGRAGLTYADLAQSFWIEGDALKAGAEVFSLFRDSELDADTYLDRFFDTGNERQRRSEESETPGA
jgi:hypothetical protein